ncbi:putative UAA transporter family Triose phosphate Transporter family [Trypanosoma vivax]|uniref:Putative lipophosphoglycan biosynthetic protein 2 n=1 Tax=Trypanosoma vivax (strain Y486) TaxID=1055687 RepID=G0TU33_TRYVY|nr:putative lipophosphoglycan biosynthetic protein 2 [Trypanosoma vivax]KAH8614143.1 putative UAA transporter family Triose phosphate Transporter family [Trypanosoma vivax]CCC47467.1 putative lipophosphoglycan biosynthetic protein 2 [Trypanosoma vivax Y486]
MAVTAQTIASVVALSICSMGMILLNKLIMYTYKLNFPMSILFVQNACAVLLVVMAKYMGWLDYPDFDRGVAKRWLPLTILFVGMLWTSMKSLETMSVSVHSIVKGLAVILTAVGDSRLYGKRVTPLMYCSFVLMSVGSCFATKGDRWVTAWGIFWTFANIAFTVAYTLYMKQMSALCKDIGSFGPVFYNNLLSLPIVAPPALPNMGKTLQILWHSPPIVMINFTIMILVGSVMSYVTFWCMKETSPTTFSVIGTLNKIPLIFVGMVAFNQFPTALGYFGIFVALNGGLLYTYANIPVTAKADSSHAAMTNNLSDETVSDGKAMEDDEGREQV